ncbi:protein Smaug homolog 1 [Diabrotica virgifera virgifera]|uniref:Protein Smaug homolog 1 n=1 Tax=Diabrotica virgifera virgifera TaxID=50390 RepID=A0A6P7GRT2_DIAVI|nr:protein Smaug homolog 1 [Diabrotica virgifera virgifera]
MENGHIRDFSEFCEQLNEIRIKFLKWDGCERTVGLYYLMVGLPFANARFLQHTLEMSINAVNTPAAQILERNANDTAHISSFLLEPPQVALSLLLTHLPLLKPDNKKTADCYLRVIKQVFMEFITPPMKIYNECVEIMSYLYIHPAFNNDDKSSFKNLLKQVVSKLKPQTFVHSSATESSDESVSPNPDSQQNFKQRRSNSLTPGPDNPSHNQDNWYSQENLNEPPCKPRSYSLSSEKSLLAGLCNLQSSHSETRLQDLKLQNNLPAMKSITSWLKSLRLHKYSWVFNNLTYSQMVNLKEESLQSIGITKGARHKILLSVNKLKERGVMLMELETEVMNGGDLNVALKKLKSVVQSPLQISGGEDLPTLFVKVMGKVCTQMLMLRQLPDDYLMSFHSLCEKAETLEAFTEEQKRRLHMWKCQLTKDDLVVPVHNGKPKKHTNNHRSHRMDPQKLQKLCCAIQPTTYTKKSSSFPNMQNSPTWNTHRHSIGSVTLQNQLFSAQNSQRLFNQNLQSYVNTSHSGSNPSESSPKPFNLTKLKKPDSKDIENSLESLCIQMMEHALGP